MIKAFYKKQTLYKYASSSFLIYIYNIVKLGGDHRLRPSECFMYFTRFFNLFKNNKSAIMELSSPLDLEHEHRGQICLPDNKRPIRTGHRCHVVGWGHTSFDGDQSDHLMQAVVIAIPNKICNMEAAYNGTVDPRYLICAGYKKGGIDACNYDSGGAMVCNKNGEMAYYFIQ